MLLSNCNRRANRRGRIKLNSPAIKLQLQWKKKSCDIKLQSQVGLSDYSLSLLIPGCSLSILIPSWSFLFFKGCDLLLLNRSLPQYISDPGKDLIPERGDGWWPSSELFLFSLTLGPRTWSRSLVLSASRIILIPLRTTEVRLAGCSFPFQQLGVKVLRACSSSFFFFCQMVFVDKKSLMH